MIITVDEENNEKKSTSFHGKIIQQTKPWALRYNKSHVE